MSSKSFSAQLLDKIAEKIPPTKNRNTTGDDAKWAFLYFLVKMAPEQMIKGAYKTSADKTIQNFYTALGSQGDYIVFKEVNKKDLFFTIDEAATLVFLRWLDMIHDKTIKMSFKTFLDNSQDLNSLSGKVKGLVKGKFNDITKLPPYVERILEACVSPTGRADNIKITINNTKIRFKDAKARYSGKTPPQVIDFNATSGIYEANLKMKLSEIYGLLPPTTIDVRSSIFKAELNNRSGNFVPDEITMSIDQEGEPQQLSELINKNDKVSTRWNIPAMLDPGHKMLKRFGLAQDLPTMLGISNTRSKMVSSYVIEPVTFNFKILEPGKKNEIPWMTLKWRLNTPSAANPKSFVMEHAVYGGSKNSITNVTPVSKKEAGSNKNINNVSTNAKKAAKHYGDFAQILQSIVSTRESQAKIIKKLREGNSKSIRKCKAMGSGDGVLVGIYGLMATIFQRNSGGVRSNLKNNVKNTSAKIALFLDVPDFKNKIYFYNQGFTSDGQPMKNAVGGTNIARASPGFSNASRNQGPARTSATGNSNMGAAFARAKNNTNSITSNIKKLLTKNNSNNNNRKINNVNERARNVFGKIANYRKGGAISKIYNSYSKLPSNTAKLNYAKKLFNIKNKNDFMRWEQNLNMASKQSTPAASNASSVGKNGNNGNNASSGQRPPINVKAIVRRAAAAVNKNEALRVSKSVTNKSAVITNRNARARARNALRANAANSGGNIGGNATSSANSGRKRSRNNTTSSGNSGGNRNLTNNANSGPAPNDAARKLAQSMLNNNTGNTLAEKFRIILQNKIGTDPNTKTRLINSFKRKPAVMNGFARSILNKKNVTKEDVNRLIVITANNNGSGSNNDPYRRANNNGSGSNNDPYRRANKNSRQPKRQKVA